MSMQKITDMLIDDVLDEIFLNLTPRLRFDARRTAEDQLDDSARDEWLRRHIKQGIEDG